MTATSNPPNDDMPVYLDAEVQVYLAAIAAKKGVPLGQRSAQEGDRDSGGGEVKR